MQDTHFPHPVRSWFRCAAAGALALALTACATPHPRPIDVQSISSVQREIKRQLAIYVAAVKKQHSRDGNVRYTAISGSGRNQSAGPAVARPGDFGCGKGSVDFTVTNLKIELLSTLDETRSASLGLGGPIAIGAASVTPSGGTSRERANTQQLDYNLWLQDPKYQDIDPDSLLGTTPESIRARISSAPIARVLLDLRSALISSALREADMPQACFTDYPPDKPESDAGNTFTIGLAVTEDANGGVTVGIGPVLLGVAAERKATSGHSVTVTFVQSHLHELQMLRDALDDDCKDSFHKSLLCLVAQKSVDLAYAPERQVAARAGDLDRAVRAVCPDAGKKAGHSPGNARDPASAPSAECTRAHQYQDLARRLNQSEHGMQLLRSDSPAAQP